MTFLIVAGDPSGDLHASHLIKALKRRSGDGVRIAAVGGPLMKAAADEFLEDLASRGVTGFWEPAAKLPFLLRLERRLKTFLEQRRPSALICVDYYGFNRRLLALAKEAGVPAMYYISPQVWASRPGRVHVLKRLVKRMLVIFPFEQRLYEKAGLACDFVGHPLLDLVPQPVQKDTASMPLKVGILPGSRLSEIGRHLPLMLAAYERLRVHYPGARAFVFASPNVSDAEYDISGHKTASLVREHDYAVRRGLDIALCSSGTATLENALLGVPMVVVYKLSWLTYWIARALVSVPHISMANILAGRRLVPELIQHEADPGSVARAAVALLEDPRRYAQLRRDLLSLRPMLGSPGASDRAAGAILAEASL